ncbi:putative sinapate 1-glucosyltransferase [Helianthus annuus]|uniref:Putative UDP-glucuronosyl/UDP-glucosyltransferase n=1 Tax=Helianthus annuus TaxID=4232 RepID=A0A251T6P4_HELAN|nr:putative sinapate 1-glucosyltransferase [Helianthus annuus]KAJ0683759.1 putative sinapate 1-glucosyltransferase [Helianthus annuus]KAJ0687720.1 putative sinapate 1-glucosyltransferase [Helianthus annuus]
MAECFSHHVVAIPYPGRGHINSMMNLCKLIALRRPSDVLITVVVTEEWLGFIESEPKPPNIRFATIPNVIPSEKNRAADLPGFIKAAQTKMEDPAEQLLRGMKVPISVLLYDCFLYWVLNVGERLNIRVASLSTISATVFSMFYHYHLLVENGHVGDKFSGEIVDYIPGVPHIRVADLVTSFNGLKGKELTQLVMKAILMCAKAQFLIFASVYELEAQVIDAFRSDLSMPVYAIGPTIPCYNLNDVENDENTPDYVRWLDLQPEGSVLYISQGSFLSVTNAQLDEIVAGVHDSGVRYMWIAREETSRFKQENDEKGLVIPWCDPVAELDLQLRGIPKFFRGPGLRPFTLQVRPWCDQLRVLRHGSIGAFWTHCGWNSTKESAFCGKPMITFPIFVDQVPNSKMVVDDWKIGRRVTIDEGVLVTREEISKLISSVMDLESETGKEMRKRAKEVEKICRQATGEGGSAQIDLDSFIRDISIEP